METYGKRAPYIAKWKVQRLIEKFKEKHTTNFKLKALAAISKISFHLFFKAGVTEEGKLTFVDMNLYCDSGSEMYENSAGEAVHFAQNVYNATAWKVSPHAVITDVMTNTYCRGPGSTQVK